MKMPSHAIEIFLQPGELYFGDRNTRIRTILGSCVSITMWHPRKLIGGMCHYMLPDRGSRKAGKLDGRFADEAMQLLMKEIRAAGTSPHEYQVKVFGGGNMFRDVNFKHPAINNNLSETISVLCKDVPCRNREVANRLLEQYGLSVSAMHMGGTVHRQVMFDIWSGDAWVRQREVVSNQPEVAGVQEKRNEKIVANVLLAKHIPVEEVVI